MTPLCFGQRVNSFSPYDLVAKPSDKAPQRGGLTSRSFGHPKRSWVKGKQIHIKRERHSVFFFWLVSWTYALCDKTVLRNAPPSNHIKYSSVALPRIVLPVQWRLWGLGVFVYSLQASAGLYYRAGCRSSRHFLVEPKEPSLPIWLVLDSTSAALIS